MKQWYYIENGETRGPVASEDLQKLIESGTVTRSTQVWAEDLDDWTHAGDVQRLFSDGPPPLHGEPERRGSSAPGQGRRTERTDTDVPNHLTKAILVTLFCCLPAGIVSIVKASQVNGYVESGRTEKAWEASESADQWANISIGVGIVVGILYFLVIVAGNA